jgi:hypothetical protein
MADKIDLLSLVKNASQPYKPPTKGATTAKKPVYGPQQPVNRAKEAINELGKVRAYNDPISVKVRSDDRLKSRKAKIKTEADQRRPSVKTIVVDGQAYNYPIVGWAAMDRDQQLQAQAAAFEDIKSSIKGVDPNAKNPYYDSAPVDITEETKKNLGMLESALYKSNPVTGSLYGKADDYVQRKIAENEADPESNLALGFAKSMGIGMMEDALRPLSSFESSAGNMYDQNATSEERWGAVGNAALYGGSVLPVVRGAGATGSVLAREIAKQGLRQGLKTGGKEALKAGATTFAKEALPNFVNKRLFPEVAGAAGRVHFRQHLGAKGVNEYTSVVNDTLGKLQKASGALEPKQAKAQASAIKKVFDNVAQHIFDANPDMTPDELVKKFQVTLDQQMPDEFLSQKAKRVADKTKPTAEFPDEWRITDPSQHQELVDELYIPGTPVGFVERNLAALMKSGKNLVIPGGPPAANTFEYYLKKTIDGYNADAAFWYSDLGRLAESTLGKENVEEFAHSWSAFSPQKKPEQNFQEAIAAMLAGRRNPDLLERLANGDESVLPLLREEFHKTQIISQVGKPGKAFVTNKNIDDVMTALADHQKRGGGFKTRNFEGDTSGVVTGEYRTGSTQDRHQAGFYEYGKDVIAGPAEFRWTMAVTNAIAHKLGLSPRQVQAAQWFIQKSEKGHGMQGGFKSTEDAIAHLMPEMTSEIKNADPLWKGDARGTQLSVDDRKASSAFPISTPGKLSEDAGMRNAAHAVVESRPSFTLSPEMAALPDDMQELLNSSLMDAIFPGGQNRAYNAFDITHRTGAGAGSFEGNLSPNYVMSVLGGSMPKANLAGAMEGKLNLQDAIAIIKPDFFDKEGSILATFNPGPLSKLDLENLKNKLTPEGLDFTLKPDGEIVIGNFGGNPDFGNIITGLEGDYGKARSTGTSGSYLDRSAKLPRKGQKNLYETGFGSPDEALKLARNRLVPEGRGDLKKVVQESLLEPRAAVYEEIAKKAGLDPAPVRKLLDEAANDVLDRLGLKQVGDTGDTQGWYDKVTDTVGLITGKSNVSTLMHELMHKWTDVLPPETLATFEKQFGKMGSVEYYEGSARAWERYLYDGFAPNRELKNAFGTIRKAMVTIYEKLKGSPIEEAIHPDVRRAFDNMVTAEIDARRATGKEILFGASAARGVEGAGADSSAMNDLGYRDQAKFNPEEDVNYPDGGQSPVSSYTDSNQQGGSPRFDVNQPAGRDGFSPESATDYSTDPVQTPVTTYVAEGARQQRGAKLQKEFLDDIDARKATLRPGTSDYRRLDILGKEVNRNIREGTFHPEVEDMLDEYDRKMGLGQTRKAVSPSPSVESDPSRADVSETSTTKADDPAPKTAEPDVTQADVEPPAPKQSRMNDMEPNPPSETALANRITAEIRLREGFGDRNAPDPETMKGWAKEAESVDVDDLIERINLADRPTATAPESLALGAKISELEDEMKELSDQYVKAADEGRSVPRDVADKIESARGRLIETIEAAEAIGTEAARTMVARKALIKADYSVAGSIKKVMNAAKKAGVKASAEDIAHFELLAKRNEELEKRLAELEKLVPETMDEITARRAAKSASLKQDEKTVREKLKALAEKDPENPKFRNRQTGGAINIGKGGEYAPLVLELAQIKFKQGLLTVDAMYDGVRKVLSSYGLTMAKQEFIDLLDSDRLKRAGRRSLLAENDSIKARKALNKEIASGSTEGQERAAKKAQEKADIAKQKDEELQLRRQAANARREAMAAELKAKRAVSAEEKAKLQAEAKAKRKEEADAKKAVKDSQATARVKKPRPAVTEDIRAEQLRKQIETLEKQAADGSRPEIERQKLTPLIQDLTKQRNEALKRAKENSTALQEQKLREQPAADAAEIERMKLKRDNLDAQLKAGDFWGTGKKKRVSSLQDQKDTIQAQIDDLRKEIDSEAEFRFKPPIAKIWNELYGIPRFMELGLDAGALMRQGWDTLLTDPKAFFKAAGVGTKAAFDPVYASKIEREFFNSAEVQRLRKEGLEVDGMGQHPEYHVSRTLGKIPLYKESERFHKTFQNVARVEMAKSVVKNGKLSKEQRQTAFKMVNAMTGRGNWIKGDGARLLSPFLTAPRMYAGQAEMMTAFFNPKNWSSPAARKMMLTRSVARIGVIIGLYEVAQVTGNEFGIDPSKPDFLKIKINGVSYDFGGGYTPYYRMLMNTMSAIADKNADPNLEDSLLKLVKNKVAPTARLILSAGMGKNGIGEPFMRERETKGDVTRATDERTSADFESWFETFSPLIAQELYAMTFKSSEYDNKTKTYKPGTEYDDVSIPQKAATLAASFAGAGVGAYKVDENKKFNNTSLGKLFKAYGITSKGVINQ